MNFAIALMSVFGLDLWEGEGQLFACRGHWITEQTRFGIPDPKMNLALRGAADFQGYLFDFPEDPDESRFRSRFRGFPTTSVRVEIAPSDCYHPSA